MIATDYVATRSLELSRGGSATECDLHPWCISHLQLQHAHLWLATARVTSVANALAVHCGCAAQWCQLCQVGHGIVKRLLQKPIADRNLELRQPRGSDEQRGRHISALLLNWKKLWKGPGVLYVHFLT